MRRPLTQGELALAQSVFGHAINLLTIRMVCAPWPVTRAFVPGRWFGRDWIIWPRRLFRPDASEAPVALQALLVHELVHVWQAQQGINLLVAKIRAGDSAASYTYPLDCRDWKTLNIEQQASAVEHRFRLQRGGQAPAAREFYDRLCPFPQAAAAISGLESRGTRPK